MRIVLRNILLILMAAAFTGCSLVDEDLGDCEDEFNLDYELQLVTNFSTEIGTELGQATDAPVASALKDYLKDIFTDYAHDVDLSFYDVVRDPQAGDSLRLYHNTALIDGNRASYTLHIRARQYHHLVVANIEENGAVSLAQDDRCHASRLVQPDADTVNVHRTGLFTARLPMDIKENEDQTFEVTLYMANCATALVIDTLGSGVGKVKAFATGFATDFRICDSTYVYRASRDKDQILRSDVVDISEPGRLCFTTVNFPSRASVAESKAQVGTEDPEGTSCWQYKVYCSMPDGTVTESVLSVSDALLPGELRIIKGKVLDNGAVQPSDPTVGVSVTLEWGSGMIIPVDL